MSKGGKSQPSKEAMAAGPLNLGLCHRDCPARGQWWLFGMSHVALEHSLLLLIRLLIKDGAPGLRGARPKAS